MKMFVRSTWYIRYTVVSAICREVHIPGVRFQITACVLIALVLFGAATSSQGQSSLRAGASAQVVSPSGNDFDTAEQDWITAPDGTVLTRSASAQAGANSSSATFISEFGRLRGKTSAVVNGTGSLSASSDGPFESINNFVGAGFFDTITLSGPGPVSLRISYSFHSVNVDPNTYTLAQSTFKLDTFSSTLGNRNEPTIVHSGAGERMNTQSFVINGVAGDRFELLAEMSGFSSVNLLDGVAGEFMASSDATNTAYVTIEPVSGSFTSLSGATYPISETSPEIKVMQGTGPKKNLKDNVSTRNFGRVTVGKKSKAMVFSIKNDGTATLEDLNVTLKGALAIDFQIVKKPAMSLAPGMSSQFKVIFKPAKKRISKAVLHISSTDADENPFRVSFEGIGVK
jgi:hypothetical protein